MNNLVLIAPCDEETHTRSVEFLEKHGYHSLWIKSPQDVIACVSRMEDADLVFFPEGKRSWDAYILHEICVHKNITFMTEELIGRGKPSQPLYVWEN